MTRLKVLTAIGFVAVCGAAVGAFGVGKSSAESYASPKPSCLTIHFCTEVDDPYAAFGTWKYVGHDEPSTEFYSTTPGSGANMQYDLTLPKDPPAGCSMSNGNSCNVLLHPAFWFGMALCATQSYPEQVSTCTPDSDKNIVDPTKSTKAPGVAFMELQFYAPGWVPQFANSSCDATEWCAALNIDSLSEDPINGTTLNSTCQSEILGGVENVNFAYLTHDGKPIGPPNPLQFQVLGSGDPQGNADVEFMKSGDDLQVTLHDTANGLETDVNDLTTGTSGTMTASASNHFGQIQYAPTGTTCNTTYAICEHH